MLAVCACALLFLAACSGEKTVSQAEIMSSDSALEPESVSQAESETETSEEPLPEPESEPEPEPESEPEPEPESEPEPEPESEPEPEPDRSKEYVYEQNPELTPVNYESPALLPATDDMGQDYQDSIVFICDSPTYWMGPFGLLKDGADTTQIWTGPEGTMTLAYQSDYKILDPFDRQEKPIREVVRLHKPERMVIALGINGIMFMDEEYFTAEYTDLVTDIKEISPETDLILQSMYPITPAYKNWGAITNVLITEGNSWILKIAEATGCRYLDTFSVLVGDDGNAKPELMQADGLHPNKDGLTLVLGYIRTHGHEQPDPTE